ncbi:hypothetical protein BSL82_12970 [Tardibacter chloracetimidivorans]|uniref:Uncharacterized protein n=1 Tax=Tardibacter chloracetimidivorans TaxID=1921510 RepID=A0A1L3ZWU8_9SPHN|nr:hypothetical protein [Tardibacter chloracetimidivorans]API60104.1 hypothetical protein BSL82_12970 [Tardibacter chloracetimidivorans]
MIVDFRQMRYLAGGFCSDADGPLMEFERHVALMPGMYMGVGAAVAVGLCRDIGRACKADRSAKSIFRLQVGTGLVLTGMLAASLIDLRVASSRHLLGEWLVMMAGMLVGHLSMLCGGIFIRIVQVQWRQWARTNFGGLLRIET